MANARQFLAARTAAWAKSGYTALDYVQDGLIAMWDGIENAGWGVHDPNATTWKNLVGSGDFEKTAGDHVWSVSDRWIGLIYPINRHCEYSAEISDLSDAMNGDYTIERVDFNLEIPGNYPQMTFSGIWFLRNGTYGLWTNLNGAVVRFYTNVANIGVPDSVAITVQGNDLTWYLNGQKIEERSIGGTRALDSDIVSFGGANTNWYGQYGAVRVSNKCLTAAEIAANYAVDRARFGLP